MRRGKVRGGARGGGLRGGVVLLEVVVSLGLLVFGLAVVGLQINAGLAVGRSANIKTRAVMLVDTKLAELESGVLLPEINEDEMTGDFGIDYPGYTWRVEIAETDIDDLFMLTLQIGYNERLEREQIDDPEMELDIEDPGTKIVRTAHLLWPRPADVNLARDFGVTDEEIEAIQDEIPIPGLDPRSLDPAMIAQLPPEVLEELMPLLEGILGGGGGLAALQNLSDEQREAVDKLRDEVGDGELRDLVDEARGGRGRRGRQRDEADEAAGSEDDTRSNRRTRGDDTADEEDTPSERRRQRDTR